MQRTILSLFLFALKIAALWMLFGCKKTMTQKEFYLDGNLKMRFDFYRGENGEIVKHGKKIKNFSNGNPALIVNYNQGEKDGLEKIYSPDRQLITKTLYQNGNPVEYTEWDLEGELVMKQKLKRVKSFHQIKNKQVVKILYTTLNEPDVIHGPFREYFSNGNIKEKTEYIKGIKEGTHIEYYVNGQIYKKGQFNQDLKHGKWLTWFRDGTLQSKTHFNMGKIYGEFCRWHPNGNLHEKGKYDEGLLTQPLLSWHGNGELKSRIEIDDFGNNNTVLSWYPSGQIQSITKNNGLKKNSPFIEWYPSGQLKYSVNYMEEKLEGKFLRWHQNGIPFVKANYKAGNLNGIYKWWEESGKMIGYKKFQNGKLLFDSKSDIIQSLMGSENFNVPLEFKGFQWGMTREETLANINRLEGNLVQEDKDILQAHLNVFPGISARITLGFNDWDELWNVSMALPIDKSQKFSNFSSWIEKELGHKFKSKKVYSKSEKSIRSAESNWGQFFSQSQKKFSKARKNHVVTAGLYQEMEQNKIQFVFRNYLLKFYSQTNHIIVSGPEYNLDSES